MLLEKSRTFVLFGSSWITITITTTTIKETISIYSDLMMLGCFTEIFPSKWKLFGIKRLIFSLPIGLSIRSLSGGETISLVIL